MFHFNTIVYERIQTYTNATDTDNDTLREMYYSKMLGVTETAPEYKPEYPKIYAFLARAAGQDVQLPRAETREQRYWLAYIQQKGI